MGLLLKSPCKINLFLNVLSKRDDGFHELESIIQPIPIFDELRIEKGNAGVQLTCSDPNLSEGNDNLVYQAAKACLNEIDAKGVKIHLQKNLPLAAGIGAGSGNAAYTLRGINEVFGFPFEADELQEIAMGLGSDVPFFLQDGPAMVTGRGEKVETVKPFKGLQGRGLLLIHPGFGISTPWAYQTLAEIPEAYGEEGGMMVALDSFHKGEFSGLFDSLEKPVFGKYLILPVLKDFLLGQGVLGALMSGSGSTMFAITEDRPTAEALRVKYHQIFGQAGWSAAVSL